MARRHTSLAMLSRDHHHGLALALRLVQGEKALLNDGWTHDRQEQARRVLHFFEVELRPHFRAEEEILFPAMREHAPETVTLIDRLLREHRDLKAIAAELAGQREGTEARLIRFAQILEGHIRAEERELFPVFEAKLPDAIAREIGARLERSR